LFAIVFAILLYLYLFPSKRERIKAGGRIEGGEKRGLC